jgi:hypothetical protein
MSTQTTRDFLDLAKQRWKLADEADYKQRARERQDLRSYAGEIWDEDTLAARAAQPDSGDLPPVPARMSLSIPLIQEPIKQVINNERAAELGVEIAPADDFGDLTGQSVDETEIELREGLVRRIQRDSEAADARIWAAARAVQAGRGYWGVLTRYLPGKTWDQEVFVTRFYNQASVSLDPAHEQPDGSDAEWAFVGNDIPWDEYKARWPKIANGSRNWVSHATEDEFRGLMDEAPDWFTTEGDVRMCRVCDYWYTERTTRELILTAEGVFWADEVPAGLTIEDRRSVTEKTIHYAQIDGAQILDEIDWPGPDIPIIKVLGEELQPYDAERRAQGMVRPARDSVLAFNAMTSKLVETIGLTPIPPWQVTPDQVQGFERWYQLSNTRALPYLPYNLVSDAGQPLGPPTRTPIDTPVAAIAGAIQLFRETIQSTTGVHDPQLGRVDPSLKSGRAIKFLQEQSRHGTSNFMDNYERSLRREGHIINNLLYPIYGKRAGRIARIVTPEGTAQTVAINGPAMQQPMRGPTPQKTYQLTEGGHFNVIVKIGRAYESRRMEEASLLADLLSSNPIFMTWFGDLFFKNSDGPGHLEMAERAKAMLDPKIAQTLAAKEQGTQIPPQVQAQMMQLMQRVQQAEQIMQAQQQELQSKQAESQIKLQIAQLDQNKDIRLQQMRDATAIRVAQINALTKGIVADNDAQIEAMALAHEAACKVADQEHEERLVDRQQAHATVTGALDQEAQRAEADRQREHELALQPLKAAKAEPEPAQTE